MNYIVIDLEWNQPFSKKKTITTPFSLNGEIIQIGAVKLDPKFQYVDDYKINIAPKFYTKMNNYVQKLTGIDNAQLSSGKDFQNAFKDFEVWCGPEYTFLTWGYDDIDMLRDNLQLYEIPADIPKDYNVQIIFNDQITKDNRQWSLSAAMEKLSIKTDHTAHDALNDSIHTAMICQKLDMNKGLLHYSQSYQQMRNNGKLNKIEFKGYQTLKSLTEDPKPYQICCPVCNKLTDNSPWIKKSNYKYIAITKCPTHGDFFTKVQVSKEQGFFLATQITYEISEERMNAYHAKPQPKSDNASSKNNKLTPPKKPLRNKSFVSLTSEN